MHLLTILVLGLERSLTVKVLVRDIMNSPPVTGKEYETAASLAKKMVKYRVGSVFITDGGKVKGVVTDGDLVSKVVSENKVPQKVRAKDVMSTPLYTVEADKDILFAARMMRKAGVKRLGVTYKGDVVGVVSMSDIISVTPELMDILSEKAQIQSGGRRESFRSVSGYCDTCGQWSDGLAEVDGKFLCEECRTDSSKGED
jgi:signal-transduction protein with cAMP-binding, CBS, and nucleotidyltransferase domain